MTAPLVHLLVSDDAVRRAIRFALEVEGIGVVVFSGPGELQNTMPGPGACLVMDAGPDAPDMLAALEELRRQGMAAAAVILATSPSAGFCRSASKLDARVVEKPLLCDELVTVIRRLCGGERPR